MIEVIIQNTGQRLSVDEGTTLSKLYEIVFNEKNENIVCATVNNKPCQLSYKLYKNKSVRFLTVDHHVGRRTYMHSLVMVMYKAVSEILANGRLKVEHSISDGYFCLIFDDGKPVSSAKATKIKERMRQIIDQDLPFENISKPTTEVVKMFEERGERNIAELLKQTRVFYSTYCVLDGLPDLIPTCTVPSTGYLKTFDLNPYYDGYLLQLPSKEDLNKVSPLVLMPKLYNTYKNNWSLENRANLTTIADINKISDSQQLTDLIKVTEALHEKNIVRIADKITSKKKVKVVLIAGPSSSGKTTFSKRLSVQLAASGVYPVALSLDNYFIDRDTTPLDENGEHDFETLYALDLKRFYHDLEHLINGDEVETPIYNFETGHRDPKGNTFKLGKNEVLVIEGIHALNPELTKTLPQDSLFKIFVSALNTLSLNDHNCIPADETRLLRRIIRDYKFRCYSAEATILRWPSVRRGEFKWIEPYHEVADEMFNSSLLFELAAVRRQAEPLLREVPQYSEAYPTAHRLLKLMSYIKPIDYDDIPFTSLLREFVGGSNFRY